MSSFYCPKCQIAIIDSEKGYITGCVHFPLETKTARNDVPQHLKDIFGIK